MTDDELRDLPDAPEPDPLSVFNIIENDTPTDFCWQSLADNLACAAQEASAEYQSAYGKLGTLLAKVKDPDLKLELSDLVCDIVGGAAGFGAVVGYALAKTWSGEGLEEMDGWLRRAVEFAGIELVEEGAGGGTTGSGEFQVPDAPL